jgi:hypothetical protein
VCVAVWWCGVCRVPAYYCSYYIQCCRASKVTLYTALHWCSSVLPPLCIVWQCGDYALLVKTLLYPVVYISPTVLLQHHIPELHSCLCVLCRCTQYNNDVSRRGALLLLQLLVQHFDKHHIAPPGGFLARTNTSSASTSKSTVKGQGGGNNTTGVAAASQQNTSPNAGGGGVDNTPRKVRRKKALSAAAYRGRNTRLSCADTNVCIGVYVDPDCECCILSSHPREPFLISTLCCTSYTTSILVTLLTCVFPLCVEFRSCSTNGYPMEMG